MCFSEDKIVRQSSLPRENIEIWKKERESSSEGEDEFDNNCEP